MARENPAFARIREEYATKYLIAREEADLRRAEIHLAIPEVAEIDRALGRTGLSLMEASMQGEDVQVRIAAVRKTNEELRHVRAELLTSHGYPADYTEVRYECPLCNDSGFVDTRMCVCMKKKLVEAGFEASGMDNLLREQSFENFDLTYYQNDPAAHRRMEQILARMRLYTESFEAGKSGNLVLFGGTGLGKTHLSTAVAKTVLDAGHDVLYTTAVGMLSAFEAERFGNASGPSDESDVNRYYSVDLLIIDDLGTEVSNQFTVSTLYNVINTRLNLHRPTIISTNLMQEELRRRYWDRITSRLLGEYRPLIFLGTDVRAQKIRAGQ